MNGTVVDFAFTVTVSGLGVIPHIGWNALQITKDTPLLQGADGQHVYFVHSYRVLPVSNEPFRLPYFG